MGRSCTEMSLSTAMRGLAVAMLLACCEGGVRRTFRAAVYEHNVILPPVGRTVTRAEAVHHMNRNLDVYETQVENAARQNAVVIVFPEDGVYGPFFSRRTIKPYLEFIPNPSDIRWNPCGSPSRLNNTDVQRRLSCMARKYSLFLVANIGDKQPCNPYLDPKCPSDYQYQYNTDVVYSPDGTLVARYHKQNLFYEEQFNAPSKFEIITFDTPFGRFGIFTCFDILFHDPAIDLIVNNSVGNIVFPTAWIDSLPLLSAIQFHSGFARGLRINLLTANLHLPLYGFQGSGIYTPDGAAAYCYNDKNERGKLLVAEIVSVNASTVDVHRPAFSVSAVDGQHIPYYFNAYVYHDYFSFVLLSSTSGTVSVCQKNVCCFLEFDIAGATTELYALGAFDGLHTFKGNYYQQICALLKCADNLYSSCGLPSKEASTTFKYLSLRSQSNATYIYPQVLISNGGSLGLAPGQWKYKHGILVSIHGIAQPLLTSALFGRVYSKDI